MGAGVGSKKEIQYSVHVCKTGVCVAYEEKFQPINKFNSRVTAHPNLKYVLAPLRKSITFYTYSIKYLNKETLLHCYFNPNAYLQNRTFTLGHLLWTMTTVPTCKLRGKSLSTRERTSWILASNPSSWLMSMV